MEGVAGLTWWKWRQYERGEKWCRLCDAFYGPGEWWRNGSGAACCPLHHTLLRTHAWRPRPRRNI